MRPPLALPLVAALACGTNGGSPGALEAESPTDVEREAPVLCAETSSVGALATFSGATCGWTLRPTAAGVELVHATAKPTSRTGELPAPCEAEVCRFRGVETSAGPLVVVEIAGPHSELPVGVWLGLLDGDELKFVDLWAGAGDSVVDDGVELGPAHALAPFDCEGTVVLRVEARLRGAESVEPPEELLALQGAGDVPPSRCTSLPLGLP